MSVHTAHRVLGMRDYLAIIRLRLWLLVLCAGIAAVAAYGASRMQRPIYRATTVMVVQRMSGQDTYNALLASDQLATVYASLVKQPIILQDAANQVGGTSATALAGKVEASVPSGSPLIQIQVDDPNPVRAASLANVIGQALSQAAAEQGSGAGDVISVFQPATPPLAPDRPKPLLNALIAGFLGLALSLCYVLVVAFVDDRLRTPAQIEELLGAPVLSTFPILSGDGLLLTTSTSSSLAESVAQMERGLSFAGVTRPLHTILVTSSLPGEGKTAAAVNLALGFAQSGRRVLLVDADLRDPNIHAVFELSNMDGLSLSLIKSSGSLPVVTSPAVPNLYILTAGPKPPNPTELLGSDRMRQLLQVATATHSAHASVDVVVLDSPALQTCDDAAALAKHADGTMLIVDSKRARYPTVILAKEKLVGAHARIVGAVLNRASHLTVGHGGPLETSAQVRNRESAELPSEPGEHEVSAVQTSGDR